MKLAYKTKKWDRNIIETGKSIEQIKSANNDMISEELNIHNILWNFLDRDNFPFKEHFFAYDKGSVLDMIAHEYMLWAWYDYQFGKSNSQCIGHLYQSILAYAKSYSMWKSGLIPNNPSVLYNRKQGHDMEQICFHAVAINEFEIFEEYADGLGAEIIKAFYHQDYEKASILVSQLPDTHEMYQRDVNRMSYYYGVIYMKNLYTAILEQNEIEFNKSLEERMRYVRKGYIMAIDAVSVSMIKFAKKVGINCKLNVIEIPSFLLEDKLNIEKNNYTLPLE